MRSRKKHVKRFHAARRHDFLKPGRWWHITGTLGEDGLRTYVNGQRWPVPGWILPQFRGTLAAWVKQEKRGKLPRVIPGPRAAAFHMWSEALPGDLIDELYKAGTDAR